MPGPGWYFIGQEEMNEVMDVLTSREISRYRFDDQTNRSVPKVYQFEREFKAFMGGQALPCCKQWYIGSPSRFNSSGNRTWG